MKNYRLKIVFYRDYDETIGVVPLKKRVLDSEVFNVKAMSAEDARGIAARYACDHFNGFQTIEG